LSRAISRAWFCRFPVVRCTAARSLLSFLHPKWRAGSCLLGCHADRDQPSHRSAPWRAHASAPAYAIWRGWSVGDCRGAPETRNHKRKFVSRYIDAIHTYEAVSAHEATPSSTPSKYTKQYTKQSSGWRCVCDGGGGLVMPTEKTTAGSSRLHGGDGPVESNQSRNACACCTWWVVSF
jgi:hypothetical protein